MVRRCSDSVGNLHAFPHTHLTTLKFSAWFFQPSSITRYFSAHKWLFDWFIRTFRIGKVIPTGLSREIYELVRGFPALGVSMCPKFAKDNCSHFDVHHVLHTEFSTTESIDQEDSDLPECSKADLEAASEMQTDLLESPEKDLKTNFDL
ncbi:hypothetical protein ElyMa_003131000 [Elysia marginata]|uniref:Uncharacterized protein n=1 Tax=Elysia marginata TaxID=1093978 RepID=A0AAV4IS71_9GAST|nr:hypothetical protein ElyMa_003131000 [Elysia marginata]